MSAIFFRPWIGDEYQAGLRYGKRVMILGESHYEWDADEKPDPDWTRTFIGNQISGEHTHAFWTRVVGAFIGHKPDLAEKQEFWRSVAFYNYIQESAGDGPRIRPTPEMWIRSEPGFAKVLKKYAPQVLIVLGYQLWNNIPDLGGAWDKPINGAPQTQTWRYPLEGGGTCLAYGIRHPSSGFSGSVWRPFILKAIRMA
jgi:hypothetical protein